MKSVSRIQDYGAGRIKTSRQSPEHAAHGIVAVDQIKLFLLKKGFQLFECFIVLNQMYRGFFDE